MENARATVRFAEKVSLKDDEVPQKTDAQKAQEEAADAIPAVRKDTLSNKKRSIYDLASDSDDKAPASIHEAAERGLHKDIIRMVERTLDFEIDQRDRYGRTALMWAAEMGHIETAETLIDLNCDRKATDPQTGRNALHLAARAGNAEMLRVLLEDLEKEDRVAFVNEADKNGITAVFLAKQKGDDGLAAFEYLMECGARYNQQAWKQLGELPPMPPSPRTPTVPATAFT
ncbi:hypothetical protein WJX72_010854 [[Myrmecia] bisecta]|uniref:Uncharacterized protein n=1 Tax=[Myrmecia] bisecta TaxID=41462 RepID=A0AAW1Q4S0_9CHLO